MMLGSWPCPCWNQWAWKQKLLGNRVQEINLWYPLWRLGTCNVLHHSLPPPCFKIKWFKIFQLWIWFLFHIVQNTWSSFASVSTILTIILQFSWYSVPRFTYVSYQVVMLRWRCFLLCSLGIWSFSIQGLHLGPLQAHSVLSSDVPTFDRIAPVTISETLLNSSKGYVLEKP